MKRRILSLAAVAGALALPLPAAAGADADRVELGTGAQPSVQFTAILRGNEVVKVKNFRYFDIAMACDQGEYTISRGPKLAKMDVSNDRFGDKFNFGDLQIKVGGKFSNKGRKAEGTVRVQDELQDSGGTQLTNCDSGKVTWKAGS